MSCIRVALISILFAFVFSGCAQKAVPQPAAEAFQGDPFVEEIKTIKNELSLEPSQRAALFMSAVSSLDNGDFESAALYLEILYKETQKPEYLTELVKVYSATKNRARIEELLTEALKKNPQSIELKKMLAASYIEGGEYNKALTIASEVAKKTALKEDFDTAGSIAYVLSDYEVALKFFRESYQKRADHISADRIATVLSLMNRDSEAVAFLDTHSRMFGCSKYICEKLAATYIQRSDKKGALDIYKRLYLGTKDEKYIKKIIELSIVGSDIDGLISFLSKTKKDDVLLFEAYKYKKDNKNAAATAMRLYNKTKNLDYLAQATIYKFESFGDKKPKWLIDQSVKNLSIVTKELKNDIYDNYLGYLLIDYDIDLSRGVELVKRALQKEPNSPFYKDSLAWGLYKQKKCTEALEIIKEIQKELKDDKTVVEHFELIKKCVGEGR